MKHNIQQSKIIDVEENETQLTESAPVIGSPIESEEAYPSSITVHEPIKKRKYTRRNTNSDSTLEAEIIKDKSDYTKKPKQEIEVTRRDTVFEEVVKADKSKLKKLPTLPNSDKETKAIKPRKKRVDPNKPNRQPRAPKQPKPKAEDYDDGLIDITVNPDMEQLFRSNPKAVYEKHVEPYIDWIKSRTEEGYTRTQIAKALGIQPASFRTMINENKELQAALRAKRDFIVATLEATLLAVATGRAPEVIETSEEQLKWNNNTSSYEKYVTIKTTKKYGVNIAALIFSLKNYTKDTGKWTDVNIENVKDLVETFNKHVANSDKIKLGIDKYINKEEAIVSETNVDSQVNPE